MAGANTASVDMGSGYKTAHMATQQQSSDGSKGGIPVSKANETRKDTSAAARAKAKKKAKLAKASRKKNK